MNLTELKQLLQDSLEEIEYNHIEEEFTDQELVDKIIGYITSTIRASHKKVES